jgi:hypothetical protein
MINSIYLTGTRLTPNLYEVWGRGIDDILYWQNKHGDILEKIKNTPQANINDLNFQKTKTNTKAVALCSNGKVAWWYI